MKNLLYYFKKIQQKWAFFTLLPSTSFAASSNEDVLSTILNNATSYAQSGPARALCVLAIAGAGYLWIGKGAIPKAYAIAIMCGSGFIFGAGYIGTTVLGIQAS